MAKGQQAIGTPSTLAPRATAAPAVAVDDMEQFPTRLRRMCREERAEFFDIRKAWEDSMLRSYKPYDYFARDSIHGNSRGKQVIARILGRYFEPKDAAR